MNEKDIAALDQATPKTLAEWWCELNRWGWPDALGEPESDEYKPRSRRGQIMREIANRITHKECLREWNKTTLPGTAFDAWWDRNRSAA